MTLQIFSSDIFTFLRHILQTLSSNIFPLDTIFRHAPIRHSLHVLLRHSPQVCCPHTLSSACLLHLPKTCLSNTILRQVTPRHSTDIYLRHYPQIHQPQILSTNMIPPTLSSEISPPDSLLLVSLDTLHRYNSHQVILLRYIPIRNTSDMTPKRYSSDI